jgi:3-hydroxyisobutyrate dehydrogenase
MARNLQAKLSPTDTLRIYDVNSEVVQRFADETKALSNGAAVQVAAHVREAAEDSVSLIPLYLALVFFPSLRKPLSDEFVLLQ